MKKIIVEGHRGYCAKYPENTLISFEAAMELGVDAIEFDVWLTKDKVPMLMHDENALRTCGENISLRELTYEEARKLSPIYKTKFGDVYENRQITIPTLEELLILCRTKYPHMMLGVEIKEYTEETVDQTVLLLKKYGFFDQCWFYAFHSPTIRYIKEKYNGRTMGYPDFQMKETFPGAYVFYDEIGLNMNIVKSEIFPIYSQKGFPMHLYCADTQEDAKLCLEKGASLITANDPVPLLRLLNRI